MFGSGDSSEWALTVGIDDRTVELALDDIAQRSPRLSEIVAAARQPDSPSGEIHQAAVKAWVETQDDHGI